MTVYVGLYYASASHALHWSDPVIAFLEHMQLHIQK